MIGIDIDDCFLAYPTFFKQRLKEVNGQAYFVTGRPISSHYATINTLASNGVVRGKDYIDVICYPDNYEYDPSRRIFRSGGLEWSDYDWLVRIGKWKVEMCLMFGIDEFWDDQPLYIKQFEGTSIKTNLVSGHE